MSATPSLATWRPERASDDLSDHLHEPYSGATGEHEPVARLVDQSGLQQASDGHVRVPCMGKLAGEVRDRPDRLPVAGFGQEIQQVSFGAVEPDGRTLGGRLVRHGRSRSCVTARGQLQLSPGPICREPPTLGAARDAVKEFRYSFRSPLRGARRSRPQRVGGARGQAARTGLADESRRRRALERSDGRIDRATQLRAGHPRDGCAGARSCRPTHMRGHRPRGKQQQNCSIVGLADSQRRAARHRDGPLGRQRDQVNCRHDRIGLAESTGASVTFGRSGRTVSGDASTWLPAVRTVQLAAACLYEGGPAGPAAQAVLRLASRRGMTRDYSGPSKLTSTFSSWTRSSTSADDVSARRSASSSGSEKKLRGHSRRQRTTLTSAAKIVNWAPR
jgi:hypothetical protein